MEIKKLDHDQWMEQANGDWEKILSGACLRGNLQLVQQSIVTQGAKITGDALFYACSLETPDVLDYLISQLNDTHFGDNLCWGPFLEGLIKAKKISLAVRLMERVLKVATFAFLDLMVAACRQNCIELAEVLIQKAKIKKSSQLVCMLQEGLKVACFMGHADMLCFLINHGANNFDDGLLNASWGGHVHIIHTMIKHGATNVQKGMDCAILSQKLNAILVLKKYGANDHGLLDNFQQKLDKITNCLDQVVCRDVLDSLISFFLF